MTLINPHAMMILPVIVSYLTDIPVSTPYKALYRFLRYLGEVRSILDKSQLCVHLYLRIPILVADIHYKSL